MIVQLEAGKMPAVRADHRGVALWAEDEGTAHGFLFDSAQATSVAVALLRESAELSGDNLAVHDVSSVAFDTPSNIVDNSFVRMVFEIGGAPVAATLTLDQFSDLAANCAVISRNIDAAFPRKPDN